jgi:SAM-dependent methyltransferase
MKGAIQVADRLCSGLLAPAIPGTVRLTANAKQLIRRGALWSGLDVTAESVERVRARLELRALPYDSLRQRSALDIPWPDGSFDVVFSHGVLHHIPDIHTAQSEIHRVLRPSGTLIAMLYARRSLNYQLSIRVIRRLILALAYPLRRTRLLRGAPLILRQHLENAEREGLARYLQLDAFTHRNTDGPLNPYERVYSPQELAAEFPDFELIEAFNQYMHVPPLPVRKLPRRAGSAGTSGRGCEPETPDDAVRVTRLHAGAVAAAAKSENVETDLCLQGQSPEGAPQVLVVGRRLPLALCHASLRVERGKATRPMCCGTTCSAGQG